MPSLNSMSTSTFSENASGALSTGTQQIYAGTPRGLRVCVDPDPCTLILKVKLRSSRGVRRYTNILF